MISFRQYLDYMYWILYWNLQQRVQIIKEFGMYWSLSFKFIKQVLDNLKMYLVLIIYRTYYHANIYFVYASTSYLDRRAFTLNIGTLIINVFGKFYNLSTILFGVITTSFHISTIIINSRTTYIYMLGTTYFWEEKLLTESFLVLRISCIVLHLAHHRKAFEIHRQMQRND